MQSELVVKDATENDEVGEKGEKENIPRLNGLHSHLVCHDIIFPFNLKSVYSS